MKKSPEQRWNGWGFGVSDALYNKYGRYGTIPNFLVLEQDGIHAYLPTYDPRQNRSFYPAERFQYNVERDLYLCPQGQKLHFIHTTQARTTIHLASWRAGLLQSLRKSVYKKTESYNLAIMLENHKAS